MQTCHERDSLRAQISNWKQAGLSIALVPTMGNLHAGHLSLIDRARQEADRVVVSIFVNPTQFGPNEDFDSYPRTLEADSRQLAEAGADLLFAPTIEVMYPQRNLTWVDTESLGDTLCGANRPGHFRGVCTVVTKLFNLVQPDYACFGEKDFQQLAIIRRLVADLCLPLRIIGVPTARAASGLALSSRNGKLTPQQLEQAPQLQRCLQEMASLIKEGARDYSAQQAAFTARLQQAGFDVDYLNVMNVDTLAPAETADTHLLIALAAHLGSTRLIDNISLHIEPAS